MNWRVPYIFCRFSSVTNWATGPVLNLLVQYFTERFRSPHDSDLIQYISFYPQKDQKGIDAPFFYLVNEWFKLYTDKTQAFKLLAWSWKKCNALYFYLWQLCTDSLLSNMTLDKVSFAYTCIPLFTNSKQSTISYTSPAVTQATHGCCSNYSQIMYIILY